MIQLEKYARKRFVALNAGCDSAVAMALIWHFELLFNKLTSLLEVCSYSKLSNRKKECIIKIVILNANFTY